MSENEESPPSNPLITFLELLMVVVVFFIGAYMLTVVFNVFPANPLTFAIKLIYLSVFGFFDKSFIFILFFILFLDIYRAYKHPSTSSGIANIIFILVFVYLYLNVRNIIVNALVPLSFNTIFPSTYATINNNYISVLVFFLLIICTALNFNKAFP